MPPFPNLMEKPGAGQQLSWLPESDWGVGRGSARAPPECGSALWCW